MNRALIAMSLVAMLSAGEQGGHPVRATARPEAVVVARAPRPISLNTATSRELRGLPGVGELLAQRIIAGRPYRDVAGLRALRGLSPGVYARIAPLVSL